MWTNTATVSYSYLLFRARESELQGTWQVQHSAGSLLVLFSLSPFYPHAVKPRISSPSSILDTLICGLQISEGREGCRPSARDLPCALSSSISRSAGVVILGALTGLPPPIIPLPGARVSFPACSCRPRERDESLFCTLFLLFPFFAFCQV